MEADRSLGLALAAGARHTHRVDFGRRSHDATVSILANLRAALEGEELQAFRFATQQVIPDTGGDDPWRHQGAVEQRLRGEQRMAGRTAGLLEPRCGIHRVADEGDLALEPADLSGHQRA